MSLTHSYFILLKGKEMNPTVVELVSGIISWCTPNWIKRRQIRPLLQELNQLIALRNHAYAGTEPVPIIKDELNIQNGPSLDRTRKYLQEQIDSDKNEVDFWRVRIAYNEDRDERRRAMEQKANLITVNDAPNDYSEVREQANIKKGMEL